MSHIPDFLQLPADIWSLITRYFTSPDWYIFRCTCKRFRRITPRPMYQYAPSLSTWDACLVCHALEHQSLSLLSWIFRVPRRVRVAQRHRLFTRTQPSMHFLAHALSFLGGRVSEVLISKLKMELAQAIALELEALPPVWCESEYTAVVAHKALELGKESMTISCLPHLSQACHKTMIWAACQHGCLELLRALFKAGVQFQPEVMIDHTLRTSYRGVQVLDALEAGEFGPIEPQEVAEILQTHQSRGPFEHRAWIYQRWRCYVKKAWDYKYYRRYLAHLVSEKGKSGSSERTVPEAALFEELPFSDDE